MDCYYYAHVPWPIQSFSSRSCVLIERADGRESNEESLFHVSPSLGSGSNCWDFKPNFRSRVHNSGSAYFRLILRTRCGIRHGNYAFSKYHKMLNHMHKHTLWVYESKVLGTCVLYGLEWTAVCRLYKLWRRFPGHIFLTDTHYGSTDNTLYNQIVKL